MTLSVGRIRVVDRHGLRVPTVCGYMAWNCGGRRNVWSQSECVAPASMCGIYRVGCVVSDRRCGIYQTGYMISGRMCGLFESDRTGQK
jgi:hypothetical protein